MKYRGLFFSFLLFLFYCRYCILYSFSSAFFQDQGYSAPQIGQLAAASGLAVIFAGPAAGMLADRIRSECRVILGCLFLALLLAGAVYGNRERFWLLIILYGGVSFFDKAVSPLLDSWIVSGSRRDAGQFGRIRAVGSLGGAFCAVGVGALYDRHGFGLIFAIHMVLTLLLAFGVWHGGKREGFLRGPSGKEDGASCQDKKKAGSLGNYAVFLCIMTVLFIGVTAEVTYFPLLLGERGGTKSQLGTALFLMSVSELAGMALYKKARRRVPLTGLVLFSMLIYAGKLGLQGLMQSAAGLIMIQMLQAGTYGTLLPAVTELAPALVSANRRAWALSCCFSCMQGAGVVLGNWLAGAVCGYGGLRSAYAVGSTLCLAAAVSFWIFFIKRKCPLNL
ncbi:MAG: MFS transporter [Lachnospiraceae bacterium]|nr:MFS transporter [Lachnospiraceae bacterium]